MKPKPTDKRVQEAAKIVAFEILRLLSPEPSGYMTGRIREAFPAGLDLHEHKLSLLFGLNLAQSGIEELWPNEDREAGAGADSLN